jgi:hypothetical protein
MGDTQQRSDGARLEHEADCGVGSVISLPLFAPAQEQTAERLDCEHLTVHLRLASLTRLEAAAMAASGREVVGHQPRRQQVGLVNARQTFSTGSSSSHSNTSTHTLRLVVQPTSL